MSQSVALYPSELRIGGRTHSLGHLAVLCPRGQEWKVEKRAHDQTVTVSWEVGKGSLGQILNKWTSRTILDLEEIPRTS
jgi:hypothetical protein